GSLDGAEVEIEVAEAPNMPFEIPGGGGVAFNLTEMMSKAMGGPPKKRRKLKVRDAFAKLVEEEADKRVDQDDVTRVALADAEANGIVFLDEIDKIAVSDVRGGPGTREGVQAEMAPRTQEDFVPILSATKASLTEQYSALLATEEVTIEFADDGIAALARIAAEVNDAIENIGARRLQTVMEKLVEDISFTAEERKGEKLVIDKAFVEGQLSGIAKNADLSRYVL